MNKSLFEKFDSISAKQWNQKIHVDLKGADYNDTLIWKTNEGIDVKPFYHADDSNQLSYPANTKATQWKICQSIFVADLEKSNSNAINCIEKGAEAILFIIPSEDISINELVKGIDSAKVSLHFQLQFISVEFTTNLKKLVPNARINFDSIGQLAKTGNWFINFNEDVNTFKKIVTQTESFTINGDLYQNAGATIIQQLAYTLAHTNEYLNVLHESKCNVKSLNISFNLSVGTNYFFEIAKLRALRIIVKSLASEYNLNIKPHIFVSPTKRNKTLYDYNTNMLRTTTECMSAVLGGANTICNLQYDAIYHKNNEFGDRIARNQLLVLKHESYFNKVNNPADGAYYIENLTHQLAEKALNLFKQIESGGGFLSQLKAGTIQRKIKESALKEQKQFDEGDLVLLGTNKHPNKNDKMKNDLELYPFVKSNKRKTLIEPIIARRLSEQSEQNRLKNEE